VRLRARQARHGEESGPALCSRILSGFSPNRDAGSLARHPARGEHVRQRVGLWNRSKYSPDRRRRARQRKARKYRPTGPFRRSAARRPLPPSGRGSAGDSCSRRGPVDSDRLAAAVAGAGAGAGDGAGDAVAGNLLGRASTMVMRRPSARMGRSTFTFSPSFWTMAWKRTARVSWWKRSRPRKSSSKWTLSPSR